MYFLLLSSKECVDTSHNHRGFFLTHSTFLSGVFTNKFIEIFSDSSKDSAEILIFKNFKVFLVIFLIFRSWCSYTKGSLKKKPSVSQEYLTCPAKYCVSALLCQIVLLLFFLVLFIYSIIECSHLWSASHKRTNEYKNQFCNIAALHTTTID